MTATRDQARNIATLAAFITNVPESADRFKVSTRTALQSETLMDVSAADLTEKIDAFEAATHVITSASNWADNGAAGAASFNAQWVDGDGHELATCRFRSGGGGESDRQQIAFDGSGESVLTQMQLQNQTLLEHSLRASKILQDGYEKLVKAQSDRIDRLEGRAEILEAEKVVLTERAAEMEEEDGESVDKLITAGVEIMKQARAHEIKVAAAKAGGNGKAKAKAKTKAAADKTEAAE